MAIVMERRYGNAIVKVDDCCCHCSPEEMEERRRKVNEVLTRILSKPENAERLRKINKERYGIDS